MWVLHIVDGACRLIPGGMEKPDVTDERSHTMTEQRQTSPVQEESLDEVIVPARLHHINLKAYRFEEMRAFYTALIGMHPNAEVGTFGWYTYDSANHRLA